MSNSDYGSSQGSGTPGYEPTRTYGGAQGSASGQPAQGSGPAQGYGPAQGSGSGQGYGWPQSSGTPGYGASQGSQGYGSSQGYGAQQGQGYGAQQGQGYGPPQGYDAQQGYGGQQAYGGQPSYGAPQGGYGASPAYGAPAGYGAPGGYGPRPEFQPTTWLLQLPSGARSLMRWFITLGAIGLIGILVLYGVLIASLSNSVNNASLNGGSLGASSPATSSAPADNNPGAASSAADKLDRDYSTLGDHLGTWEKATTNCNGDLTCVTKQDNNAAGIFTTFSKQLAATPVPAAQQAEKAKLAADTTALANAFTALNHTTTGSQYQSTVSSTHLQQNLDNFDADYSKLVDDLRGNS